MIRCLAGTGRLAYGNSSAEGEGECFGAGIEEFDVEPSIYDRLLLADELVHARLGEGSVALLV